MRIYFVRHGESHANILRQISNRGLVHPLTRQGRQQAIALADKLRPFPLGRIYSSPLLRAIETSIILATQLDVDYEVVDALREFDCGVAEGRTDEAAWQMWRGIVDDWLDRELLDRRIEGGESFQDLQARFVPFIESLTREYGDTDAGLICVAHGGVYWMMLPLVLKNVDHALIVKYRIKNAACIVAELRPEGLVCVEWNGEKL